MKIKSYFKEIEKTFSCFLIVNDSSLDLLIRHHDNIHFDQAGIHYLTAIPACQISFDCSLVLGLAKHFNNIKVYDTHVINYLLNFRDL
jgi:hypothetical protein